MLKLPWQVCPYEQTLLMELVGAVSPPCHPFRHLLQTNAAFIFVKFSSTNYECIPITDLPHFFKYVYLLYHSPPRPSVESPVFFHPLEHPRAVKKSKSDKYHFPGALRARHFRFESPRSESDSRNGEIFKSKTLGVVAFALDIEAMTCPAPRRASFNPWNFSLRFLL